MGIEALIAALIIGAVAGWLAGVVVKGGGFGLIGNIVLGIVGSLVAGWLLPAIGINFGGGWVSSIISSAIGAVIILVVIGLVKRA